MRNFIINDSSYKPPNINLRYVHTDRPITVAAWSEAWTVFTRSNAGIVGSNPTRGMDVCVRLFCV
jgi:hypothetical protein